MSAQPNRDVHPSMASMEEFLADLLDDAERLDGMLGVLQAQVHEARSHLRSRLYALRLADDGAFKADVDRLADDLEAGNRPQTFSLDDVLESQGLK